MSAHYLGLIGWELDVDDEGHRTYTAKHRVRTSDPDDGPNEVFNCPGLPFPGVSWAFGNDSDPWAFCYPSIRITPQEREEGPGWLWVAEQTFSTRPLKRCQDTPIENPLNEPPKLRGGFTKFTVKATHNRNGFPIINTAGQFLVGPETEFDDARPTVQITLNAPSLPLSLFAQMINTVNDAPLWGLGARRIKLSNVTWERQLYGTCNFYYTMTYEFEVNFNTFDRRVPSMGTLAAAPTTPDEDSTPSMDEDGLVDGPPPNMDPNKYVTPQVGKGAKAPEPVFLDAAGKEVPPGNIDDIAPILISYYAQSNFLLLGIPMSIV